MSDDEDPILLDPEVMTCRSCGTVTNLLIDLKCRACNPSAFKAHDAIQLSPRLRY